MSPKPKTPNPQSPIPNPQIFSEIKNNIIIYKNK